MSDELTLLSVGCDHDRCRVGLLLADPDLDERCPEVAQRDPLVFVTVARGSDSEDDERIALVSIAQLAEAVLSMAPVPDELAEAERRIVQLTRQLRRTSRALELAEMDIESMEADLAKLEADL